MTKKEIKKLDLWREIFVPHCGSVMKTIGQHGYGYSPTIGEFLKIPAADLLKIGVGRKTLVKVAAALREEYGIIYEIPPPKPTAEDIADAWQSALNERAA